MHTQFRDAHIERVFRQRKVPVIKQGRREDRNVLRVIGEKVYVHERDALCRLTPALSGAE